MGYAVYPPRWYGHPLCATISEMAVSKLLIFIILAVPTFAHPASSQPSDMSSCRNNYLATGGDDWVIPLDQVIMLPDERSYKWRCLKNNRCWVPCQESICFRACFSTLLECEHVSGAMRQGNEGKCVSLIKTQRRAKPRCPDCPFPMKRSRPLKWRERER